MTKIFWTSDGHYKSYRDDKFTDLITALKNEVYDYVFVGGDLSSNGDSDLFLSSIADISKNPVYFVLGNHDFWGSTFFETGQKMAFTQQKYNNLFYLSAIESPVEIGENSYLIGIDGWYDFQFDEAFIENKEIADFYNIKDFRNLSSPNVLSKSFGMRQKQLLNVKLNLIPANAKSVTILTHVPPFSNMCRFRSEPTSNKFLNVMCNKLAGDVINKFTLNHGVDINVLSGHTHEGYEWVNKHNSLRTFDADKVYKIVEV